MSKETVFSVTMDLLEQLAEKDPVDVLHAINVFKDTHQPLVKIMPDDLFKPIVGYEDVRALLEVGRAYQTF